MKKQLQLKELLVKIAEDRCERLPGESDEDLLQRCGNWNFGKIAKLKYDQRVGRIRRPTIVKESNETIKCEKCGHSWKESEGGKEKYLCHICGYNNIPLQEAKIKVPDYIVTSVSSSEIPNKNIPKADVGLGLKMGGELGRGIALTKKDYSLSNSNGKVVLKLTPQGKMTVRVKSEKVPNYLDMITKFANDYLSDYAKKI